MEKLISSKEKSQNISTPISVIITTVPSVVELELPKVTNDERILTSLYKAIVQDSDVKLFIDNIPFKDGMIKLGEGVNKITTKRVKGNFESDQREYEITLDTAAPVINLYTQEHIFTSDSEVLINGSYSNDVVSISIMVMARSTQRIRLNEEAKVRMLHSQRKIYVSILILLTLAASFAIYTQNKPDKNTYAYEYKQHVMDVLEPYIEISMEDGVDYRDSYYFHLNNKASVSIFYTAIKRSEPMDYETHVARHQEDSKTSEALVFVLPGLEEEFYYSRSVIMSTANQRIIFEMKEQDSKKLHEIITKLR